MLRKLSQWINFPKNGGSLTEEGTYKEFHNSYYLQRAKIGKFNNSEK